MAEGAGEISALIEASLEAHGEERAFIRDGIWLRVGMNRIDPGRRAGWKIHLAGTPHRYALLLQKALPVLQETGYPFKCAASADIVESLNSGEYGLSQVGKAVTIYVGASEQVAPLGRRLGEVLKGLPGPRIVHDCPLSQEAPVYARFGPFDGVFRVDATGRSRRVLLHPDLGEIIDPTDGGVIAYPDAPGIPAYKDHDHLAFLRDRIIVARLLHLSAKGGVFLAIDRKRPEAGVQLLKTARAWTNSDRFGRDARWGLRREHQWLKQLGGLPGVPPAGILLEDNETTALCRPYLEGETFWELWTKPDARSGTGQRRLHQVVDTLARQLLRLHEAGCIVRDLSPANILVQENAVWILDFELAEASTSKEAPYRRGTKGFYPEQRERFARAMPEDDRYAIARLRSMATGRPVQMALTVENQQKHIKKENKRVNTVNNNSDCCRTAAHRQDWGRLLESAQKDYQTLMEAKVGDIDRHTLYDGSVGYYVFLSECALNIPEVSASGERLTLAHISHDLLEQIRHLPGAYFGAAGVALAWILQDAKAGHASGKMGREALLGCASTASSIPDVCQGVAGLGLAAWSARSVLPGAELDTLLSETGAQLEALAVEDGAGIWWPWPEGSAYGGFSGQAYLGFAHGIAGILWLASVVKTDLGRDLLPPRMLEHGFATLLRHGRSLPDGGLWWPVSRDDETCWNAWCHGTPGIVKALAAGYTLGMVDAECLRGALLGVGAANSGELCLCHGLASRVDAYADAFAALPELRVAAGIGAAAANDRQLLASALQQSLAGNGLIGPGKGLMTGLAGMVRTLFRYDLGFDGIYRKLLP